MSNATDTIEQHKNEYQSTLGNGSVIRGEDPLLRGALIDSTIQVLPRSIKVKIDEKMTSQKSSKIEIKINQFPMDISEQFDSQAREHESNGTGSG